MKLIGNKILVKIHENSDMSDSGIFIGQATSSFNNNTVQKTVGEVVAVGSGIDTKKGRRPLDCRVGEIVCFSDTCGRYFDDEHKIIQEGDIAFFMESASTVEVQNETPEYYA